MVALRRKTKQKRHADARIDKFGLRMAKTASVQEFFAMIAWTAPLGLDSGG